MSSTIKLKQNINMQTENIQYNGLIVYHNNKVATLQTIEEIFVKKPYKLKSQKKAPFIIDAGANIGISMLFFKQQYPKAKMICFEPDPISFGILKKNMDVIFEPVKHWVLRVNPKLYYLKAVK